MTLAAAIAVIGIVTVAAAWGFQWAGYAPCELCLKERLVYYAGVPLALFVLFLAWAGRPSLIPATFAALTMIFAAGTALGAYHAGVEWGLWPGPASCTGSYQAPVQVQDFLHQLNTANVVRCDVAALHVAGLSLAAWDAIVSAILAVVGAAGFAITMRS